MRRIGRWFGLMFGLVMLTACSQTGEEMGPLSDYVTADLAFFVSGKPIGLSTTRMDDAVVQTEGQAFRGLQVLQVIPFTTTSTITASDEPVDFKLSNMEVANDSKHFYYYSDCRFIPGTASMLVYGKAPAATHEGVADKMYNGSLNATFPADLVPSGITFQLEPMVTAAQTAALVAEDGDAGKIAAYMTNIANSAGWAGTENETLQNYYQEFIGRVSEGVYSNLAGSSASVSAYVDALKTNLTGLNLTGDDTANAVKTAILGNIDQSYPTDYPASKNLPDGAATLQWDGTKFVVLTESTAATPINKLTHFTYPAELYYYVNSLIHTSNDRVEKSEYTTTPDDWADWAALLGSKYPSPGSAVSHNTQAVAISSPLQYAVARMKIVLENLPASLQDANASTILSGNDKFPLTGIIIGGQRTQAFDFTPKEPLDDEDLRFIYDGYPAATVDGSGNQTVNTLVLQTYSNETIRFALEFKNESEQAFKGAGGIIYPDTKFYLIGSVDPTTSTNEHKERVFMRDCTTTLNMKVVSLQKAYNVMPNLMSPRLELGLVVADDWQVSDDTHEIYNW